MIFKTLSRFFVLTFSLVVLGCQAKDFPPVSTTAKEFKSGVALDEITKKLGKPHAPTSTQAKQLTDIISKMPESMRSNAQKDQSLAWGNDSAFFVVKVNDKGIAWITGWRE